MECVGFAVPADRPARGQIWHRIQVIVQCYQSIKDLICDEMGVEGRGDHRIERTGIASRGDDHSAPRSGGIGATRGCWLTIACSQEQRQEERETEEELLA